MTQLRMARIIVIAYAASVAVYVGITFTFTPQVQVSDTLIILPWVFFGVSTVLFLIGPMIGRSVLLSKVRSATNTAPLVQGTVVSAAIGEFAPVFGLVIWFLMADRSWLILFAAMALVYFALLYGRLESLDKLAAGDDFGEAPESRE